MDHPFRSAPLGGFNKQDVLSFLEEQSKQAAQAQQELSNRLEEANRQLEALRQERDGLAKELEEARRQLEVSRQDRAGLKVRLEKAELDMSARRNQAELMARELEKARGERDELQKELEEVLPGAQAYDELKERTAGVELDAHRRAQAIQEKAEYDAQRVRGRLERWLRCMETEYSTMRGEVETTIAHASSELDRVRAGLNRVMQLMEAQENALEGVAKVYSDTADPRPEAPMPIEVE